MPVRRRFDEDYREHLLVEPPFNKLLGEYGFLGLLVPRLARLLVGHDFRKVLLVSIPLGAAVMLYADQAARLIFTPSEIPVGLVTALVGAPLMIYVARRVL